MTKSNKIIWLLILPVIISCNTLWLKTLELGILASAIYLLIFGWLLGQLIFPEVKKGWQIMMGSLGIICSYAFLGAITYYLYKLDALTCSLLLFIIAVPIVYQVQKIQLTILLKLKLPKIKLTNIFLLVCYLGLFFIAWTLLKSSQTTQAINSPWQVIPSSFFIVYFIATLNLILFIFNNKNYLSSVLLSCHFFLTTSLALIVYPLGFGFDPFIHQATESAIWQNGFILPKPLYYLGQYALVVGLSHLTQLGVIVIDKLLLPCLLAIYLPYVIWQSLKKSWHWPSNISRLLSLIFLFVPFSLFIVTNPQAVANLLTIIIIFLALIYLTTDKIPLTFLILLTLATLTIHPLSGIPLLVFLLLIWLKKINYYQKKYVLTLLIIFSSLALPLALILNSFLSANKVQLGWPDLNILIWPNIFTQQFHFFLDLVYGYKLFCYGLLTIIAVSTYIYLFRQKKTGWATTYLITGLIIFLNSIFLHAIKVSGIIDYEQNDFAIRVRLLAFYFLLPLLIYASHSFITAAVKFKLGRLFLVLTVTSILTCTLYLSYPRDDDYENSSFVNLAQADLEVVKFIAQKADQDYIVLANQMTSAAALKTYGFTKYYQGHYFYPIPTGGPLYQNFIQMQNEPSAEIMKQSMELTGVKEAYFVLPSYWNRFTVLSAKAEKDATGIYSLGEQVYIYKFVK